MSEFQEKRDDEEEVEAHEKAMTDEGENVEVEAHKKTPALSEDEDAEVEGHGKRW